MEVIEKYMIFGGNYFKEDDMEFRKYQSLERFGKTEVKDIEIGECVIFPKIDGTNSSVWLKEGEVRAGSRKKELSLEADNAGFYKFATAHEGIKEYLKKHPTHRLYGEWLVPHSLRTYRDDAWRRFYIFDVCIDKGEDEVEYLPYNIYHPLLEEFDLDYIPPLGVVRNGTPEQFIHYLEENIFLIQDEKGAGEGIVIKNYDFYNRFGRQTWAKMVTSEFKEKHVRSMRTPQVNDDYIVEEKIIKEFCTEAFIEKEYAKLVNAQDGRFNSKDIPKLLGIIWHEFIVEESWNIVKHFRKPIIDYKLLNSLIVKKIKEVKSDVFN